MTHRSDREQYDALALIEAAQRAGRSERDIVTIVDEYVREDEAAPNRDEGVVRRLVTRTRMQNAA